MNLKKTERIKPHFNNKENILRYIWSALTKEKFIKYVDYKGNRIAYRYWNKQKGKKTLLFLYGFGANMVMLDYFVRNLPEEYKVLSIDYPGHGYSPKSNTPFTLQDYDAVLLNLLNENHEKNIILIGYSLGGVLALHFYHLIKDKTDKVILWNTLPYFNYSLLKKIYHNFIRMMLKVNYNFTIIRIGIPLLKDKYFTDELIKISNKIVLYNDPQSVIDFFDLIINNDCTSILEKIQVPVLYIYSGIDAFVPEYQVKKIIQRISICQTHYSHAHGHLSIVSDPKLYVKVMHDFINVQPMKKNKGCPASLNLTTKSAKVLVKPYHIYSS